MDATSPSSGPFSDRRTARKRAAETNAVSVALTDLVETVDPDVG